MKKMLALALAGVMIISLNVMALAEEPGGVLPVDDSTSAYCVCGYSSSEGSGGKERYDRTSEVFTAEAFGISMTTSIVASEENKSFSEDMNHAVAAVYVGGKVSISREWDIYI